MLSFLLALSLHGAFLADSTAVEPHLLEGDWRIHAGDDPAWARPDHDHSAWEQVEVPDVWETVLPGHDGFAWYRVEMALPPVLERGPLGLRFGSVGDAFEVYWNGVKIGQNGRFPPRYHEGVEPVDFLVPADALELRAGENHVLAVRVYNAYAWGGLMGGVAVGRYDLIAALPVRGEIVLGGLVAFFVAIGIYHLAFFVRRRRSRENLYFASLCVLAGAYLATHSVAFLSRTVHLTSPFRIDLVVMLLAVPTYAALVRHLFDLEAGRAQAAVSATAFLLVPVVAIAPLSLLSAVYKPMEVLMVLALAGFTTAAWRHSLASSRPPGVLALLIGLAAFSVAFAWDVASEIGWVPVAELLPGIGGLYWLGFLVLVIGVGMATSSKFALAEVHALNDSLTSLSRRHVFDLALRREMARLGRSGQHLAVAMIDLDHFKELNDAHGHRAGDAVLYEVGRVIRHSARNIDLPARVGGEEFAVLLCDTDRHGAVVFAERLQRNLQRMEVEHGGATLGASASIGIAVTPIPVDPETFMETADRNLYAAKSAGRNQIIATSIVDRRPASETTDTHPVGVE